MNKDQLQIQPDSIYQTYDRFLYKLTNVANENDMAQAMNADSKADNTLMVNVPSDLTGSGQGTAITNMTQGGIMSGKQKWTDTTTGFFIGIDTDGLAKINIGNLTKYIKWTGSQLQVIGGISTSSLDIPDAVTDNSFHVDSGGNAWWGATTFANAPATIDSKGQAVFKSVEVSNYKDVADASFAFTGTWTQASASMRLHKLYSRSNTVGDYFIITFTGPSIGLLIDQDSASGKLDIYIDNSFDSTIDLYTVDAWLRSMPYIKTGLTNTVHTLKGVVATKNGSSSDNLIQLEGYSTLPGTGILIESQSSFIYSNVVTLTTDGNGYVTTASASPTGYSKYCLVGLSLSTTVMSDATLTDPKLAIFQNNVYLYNGAPSTSYDVRITSLMSAY